MSLSHQDDQRVGRSDDGPTSEATRQIGPYLLGQRLGEGGVGTVYRGLHTLLERPVALKRLRSDQSVSDLARQRFLREGQAAARLNHPAVVQIYDILEQDGDAWIAMELVEGAPLSQVVKKGPLPWSKALDFGLSIVAALKAAHGVAILHRDLKTENVILADSGQIKVLDFGLAKDLTSAGAGDLQSQTRGVAGTPRCLSPEQAMSQPLDYRSDLFSFGVLLYELLTATSPFAAPTLLATLNNICMKPHRPLSEVDPTIPQEVSGLVDELLQKDPEQRPRDADTVDQSLRQIASRCSPQGASSQSGLYMASETSSITVDERRGHSAERGSGWVSQTGLEERRHVIVVSCELSADDAEGLHGALPELQERIRTLIRARRGCFIETPGTRLVICVGYPQAFEDDARRAVSIGRAMFSEVSACASAWGLENLQARCGLHAGIAFTPAASEDGQPELGAILDDAIDIARQAGRGQLWVSETALPLLSADYAVEEVEDSGRLGRLHWIRFDTDPGATKVDWLLDTLLPPIGRESEIQLLKDTFQSVAEGGFQVVQICGEGGIGKTKLLAGLRGELYRTSRQWVTLTGSPETVNSPFFPISTLLSHLFDLSAEMTLDEQKRRLAERLAALGLETEDLLPCLVPFLPPSLEELRPPLTLSPEVRKQQVLEALTSLLMATGEQQPTLLVFEDLHWLDPSSLEWITRLIEERNVPSLLVLLTFRPHFVPPWGHRPDIIQLNLNPLSATPTLALIADIAGKQRLPPEVIDSIVAKADGVPLFLEQLTRATLEAEAEGRSEIPGTLRGSLMARLDRLGPAKSVAQFAAVVGRDFPLQVLQAVVPVDETTLELELKRLIDAGILYRRGFNDRARLIFKHALIRDAAYDSLLKRDRRRLHRDIVRVIEDSFPALMKRHPEILAQHCTQGGLLEEAVGHWNRAASEALARSANIEAISHSEAGLRLLEAMEESEARLRQELDLRSSWVHALSAAQGYAKPELERPLERIEELARRLGDGARSTIALRGLFHLAHYSGNSASMLDYCERFLHHAKTLEDQLLIMEAHFQSGMTHFSLGDLRQARQHKEDGLAVEAALSAEDGDTAARAIGRGKAVVSRSLLALILWIEGYPDRAMALIRRTVDSCGETDPLSQALVRHNAACIFLFIGHLGEARKFALSANDLSEKNELFTKILSAAVCEMIDLQGQGAIELGAQGVPRLQQAITDLRGTGARFGISFFLCHLAEIHVVRREFDAAERNLDEVATLIDALDERVWLPEMLRIRGELRRRRGDDAGAASVFEEAIDVARRQGARSFELRAALGLARLRTQRQPSEDAYGPLQRVLSTFDEGDETPDVMAARELLTHELQ